MDVDSPPCCIRDVAVKRHENKLTAHIICIELTPYFLNKALCQLDVKLSKITYDINKIKPDVVVTADVFRSFPVSSINITIPNDNIPAVMYS